MSSMHLAHAQNFISILDPPLLVIVVLILVERIE
tara:strand:+ start:118 stop:219 length:102 start_codon:yes stop_codon:yes gene_type:complete